MARLPLARSAAGAAVPLILLLAAGCLSACGAELRDVRADANAPQALQLPAPAELAKAVSYTDADRVRRARAYSVISPSNRVSPHWVNARFDPDWDQVTNPAADGLAYAIYPFLLAGYADDPQLHLGWTAPPDYSNVWIGISRWDLNSWEWRRGSAANVLSFASLEPYISGTGAILVTVLLTGTEPATLAWLRFGARVGKWHIDTVDSSGDVDRYNSLVLDAEGLPRIAYYEGGSDDLRYASHNSVHWELETVAGAQNQGQYCSLALSPTGLPRIAAFNADTKRLEYHFHDGSVWDVSIPDNSGDVGWNGSLAVDAADRPHICYRSLSPAELRYTYFDGLDWQQQLVSDSGMPGTSATLRLYDDEPSMAYADEAAKTTHYAWHNGINWVAEQIDTEYEMVGTCLAIDAAGRPHVSLFGNLPSQRLKHDYFDGSLWVSEVIQHLDGHNGQTGIAVDAGGDIHVSYVARIADTWAIRHAWHDGSDWRTEIVETLPELPFSNTSIRLDPAGRPCISYVYFEAGFTDGILKCAILVD